MSVDEVQSVAETACMLGKIGNSAHRCVGHCEWLSAFQCGPAVNWQLGQGATGQVPSNPPRPQVLEKVAVEPGLILWKPSAADEQENQQSTTPRGSRSRCEQAESTERVWGRSCKGRTRSVTEEGQECTPVREATGCHGEMSLLNRGPLPTEDAGSGSEISVNGFIS